MSVGNIQDKRILILGREGVGKTNFLDTLALNQSKYGIDFVLPSVINNTIPENDEGTKESYDYEFLCGYSNKKVNLIANEMRIPDLSNEETKIDFFDTLSENENEYDLIFFMIDVSNNRLNNYIRLFMTKLIIYYGESILSNFVILFSKSNMIKRNIRSDIPELNDITEDEMKQFNDQYKDMKESEIDIKLKDKKFKLIRDKIKCCFEEIFEFFKERCNIRKNQICQKLKESILYYRSFLDDENEEKKQSIRKNLKNISYIQIGTINLNVKNELSITNLPDYRFYSNINYLANKFFVSKKSSTDWIHTLEQKICSNSIRTINFNRLRTIKKENKKKEIKNEKDLKLLKLAISKAEKKIKMRVRDQDIAKFGQFIKNWLPYAQAICRSSRENDNSYLDWLKQPENCISLIDRALGDMIETYTPQDKDELSIYLKLIIEEHAKLKIEEGIK